MDLDGDKRLDLVVTGQKGSTSLAPVPGYPNSPHWRIFKGQ